MITLQVQNERIRLMESNLKKAGIGALYIVQTIVQRLRFYVSLLCAVTKIIFQPATPGTNDPAKTANFTIFPMLMGRESRPSDKSHCT